MYISVAYFKRHFLGGTYLFLFCKVADNTKICRSGRHLSIVGHYFVAISTERIDFVFCNRQKVPIAWNNLEATSYRTKLLS